MKKFLILSVLLILSFPNDTLAQRGCCSRHGGVAGCNSYGRTICMDGTLSPSCTCTPPIVYGCMDYKADNYNPNANRNNGKCKYTVLGCTNKSAINYNINANKSDGSCLFESETTLEQDIPFETKFENNNDIVDNSSIVVQNGAQGRKKITYKKVIDEAGKEVSSKVIKEEILLVPIPKIVQKNMNPLKEEKEVNNNFAAIFALVLYFSLLFIAFSNPKKDTIINKIKHLTNGFYKIFLFIGYYVLFFPVIVDMFIIFSHKETTLK